MTSVEQEKEKYFKGIKGNEDGGRNKDNQDLQSKNKKRKEKRIYKGLNDNENPEDADDKNNTLEDEVAKKKRKRLALYGVRK